MSYEDATGPSSCLVDLSALTATALDGLAQLQ
jgi:hypothetical protein